MTEPDRTPNLWAHRAARHARQDAGRSRRKDVPLESHAEVVTTPDRPKPVDTLESQDDTRVQSLVPIRYGRMSRTPFTFLRGAAAIMAFDLAAGPTTDMRVQLSGDAHLSNFGLFNAPDRRLIFDLNDFDETLPGPFEWDVKRLAASIVVAGRCNGLSDDQNRRATAAAMAAYRETMSSCADQDPLDLFYFRLDAQAIADSLSTTKKKKGTKVLDKAQRKDSVRALNKLTDIVDGRRVIVPDPPLVVPLDIDSGDELDRATEFFTAYYQTVPLRTQTLLDRFSIVDVAVKVVGVGSVGTRALIVLLESSDGEPLFLQFKEAVASVLEPYAGASAYDHHGQRVVEGQKLTQAASDVMLGWARIHDSDKRAVDFYFRQMWDGKGSLDVDAMGSKQLRRYAQGCGAALALAQSRSGDASMISGYLGDDDTFDQALVEFADSYADLNESDFQQLTAAIDDGQIEVVRDL